jgi:hypothetical protein
MVRIAGKLCMGIETRFAQSGNQTGQGIALGIFHGGALVDREQRKTCILGGK